MQASFYRLKALHTANYECQKSSGSCVTVETRIKFTRTSILQESPNILTQ